MTSMSVLDLPLPVLRPDLEFYPGPAETDGSPTWTVHDPLTGIFRKFGWAEAAILQRLRTRKTLGALLRELARFTSLTLSPEEVMRFCEDAEREHLTVSGAVGQAEVLEAQADAARLTPLKWLLLHYLYIRIPLLHPDRFLTRTVRYVRWLASPLTWSAYIMAFMAGLFVLVQHWEAYVRTFPYFFNLSGILYYVLAIVLLKVVHEFSHAYVAKSFGVRVPTMGIAFLVLAPVAFCDVTDGWKLPQRRQRFWISVAGVCAELVIAGLALLAWGLTQAGPLKSVFFVLSSATLLSTLLVNVNPAMRFDGYYILGDLWGIDNLRERAFAMTRWALRKWLLGLTMSAPEPGTSARRLAGMIVYSLYAWAYRVGLYIGIAALVYYKFTKLLGAFLCAFEVYWFLLRPAVVEIRALIRLREHIRINPRLVVTSLVLLGGVLWAGLPLRRDLPIPAVILSEHNQTVYAPGSGELRQLRVSRGEDVRAGEVLFSVYSEALETEIAVARIEVERLQRAIVRLTARKGGRAQLPQMRQELRQTQAQLLALEERAAQQVVRAEINGTVYEWDESRRVGASVAQGQTLGRIADFDAKRVLAFLKEDYVGSVRPGDRVRFVACCGDEGWQGAVRSVSPLREETIDHQALASTVHGDLPVMQTAAGQMALVGSYYTVEVGLDASKPPFRLGQTGHVWIETAPRSRLFDGLRYAWRVLVRESGF